MVFSSLKLNIWSKKMKITTIDINTFDIPTLKKQHRKLAAFATASGLDYLIAQTNNAIEVLSECLKKDSSPVTCFFWSDREIIDFIKEETSFLVAQKDYLTTKTFISIAKIIQRTANTCLKNKERFKALKKTHASLQKVISLTVRLEQARLSSLNAEEEAAKKELADTILKIVSKAPLKKQNATSKPKPVKALAITKSGASSSNRITANTVIIGLLFAAAVADFATQYPSPRPELPKLNLSYHFTNLTNPPLPTCPVPPYIRPTVYSLNSTCPLNPPLNFQQEETQNTQKQTSTPSWLKTTNLLSTKMISPPTLPLSTLHSSHHFINLTSPLPSTCPAIPAPNAATPYQQLICTPPHPLEHSLNSTSIFNPLRSSKQMETYGTCIAIPEPLMTNNSLTKQTNSFSRKVTDSPFLPPVECIPNTSSLTEAGDFRQKAFVPTNSFAEDPELQVSTSADNSKALIALSPAGEQPRVESSSILSTINAIVCLVSCVLFCGPMKLIRRKNKQAATPLSSPQSSNNMRSPIITITPPSNSPAQQSSVQKPLTTPGTEFRKSPIPSATLSTSFTSPPARFNASPAPHSKLTDWYTTPATRDSRSPHPNMTLQTPLPLARRKASPTPFRSFSQQIITSPNPFSPASSITSPGDALLNEYKENHDKGDVFQANHILKKALIKAIQERHPKKIVGIANRYIDGGCPQDAYDCYKAALEKNIVISPKSMAHLAWNFKKAGQLGFAFECYYRASVSVLDKEKGVEYAARAEKLKCTIFSSNNIPGLIAIGKIDKEQGNFDNASKCFSQAFEVFNTKDLLKKSKHLEDALVQNLKFLGDYFSESASDDDLEKALRCFKRTDEYQKLVNLGFKLLEPPSMRRVKLSVSCARFARFQERQFTLDLLNKQLDICERQVNDQYRDLRLEVSSLQDDAGLSAEDAADADIHNEVTNELSDSFDEKKNSEQDRAALEMLGRLSAELTYYFSSGPAPWDTKFQQISKAYAENLVNLNMDKDKAEEQPAFKYAERAYLLILKRESPAHFKSSATLTETQKAAIKAEINNVLQNLAAHWINQSRNLRGNEEEERMLKIQLQILGLSKDEIETRRLHAIRKKFGYSLSPPDHKDHKDTPLPQTTIFTSQPTVLNSTDVPTNPPMLLSQVRKRLIL